MIELQDILRLKFPNADFTKDILLADEGNGVFIREWNLVGVAKPTKQDLDQWEQDVAEEHYDLEFNLVNKHVLSKLNKIDWRSIRALRVNDTEKLLELEREAEQLRQQLIRDF